MENLQLSDLFFARARLAAADTIARPIDIRFIKNITGRSQGRHFTRTVAWLGLAAADSTSPMLC
jgi:hypothetical protein